jgi:hypothetical protein
MYKSKEELKVKLLGGCLGIITVLTLRLAVFIGAVASGVYIYKLIMGL